MKNLRTSLQVTALASWALLAPGLALAAPADPAPIAGEVREAMLKLRAGVRDPALSALAADSQRLVADTAALLAQIAQEEHAGTAAGASRALLPGKLQQWQSLWADANKLLPQQGEAKRGQALGKRVDAVTQSLLAVIASGAAAPAARSAALGRAQRQVLAMARPAPSTRSELLAPAHIMEMRAPPHADPGQPAQGRPAYLSYGDKQMLYAFLGNALLAAAPPTLTEATTCNYTAADLSLSADEMSANGTNDLQPIFDLAAKLNYAPAKMYQYVANEIAFEPYYGSLKGALGTLVAKSGNATDQASLLIALLRSANVPARYVKANVVVNDERVNRWLGARGYDGSVNILGQGGIPTGRASPGVGWYQVWVEACVPYGNYRGGAFDNSGHRWIPLDPSFKDKSYQGRGTVAASTVAFPYSSYLAKRSETLPAERYEQVVRATLSGNQRLEDIPYLGSIVPRAIDVLPASLPYTVTGFLAWDAATAGFNSAETAVLPDKHRYKLTLTARRVEPDQSLTQQLSTTLAMPANILKRITLSPAGATAGDQASLDAWQAQTPGGTAPASINVVPRIKVEGATLATGGAAVPLNTSNGVLEMTLNLGELNTQGKVCGAAGTATPTASNCVVYRNIKAANYHALQAYGFQVSDGLLQQRTAKLLNTLQTVYFVPESDLDGTLGEYLHLAGLKYMRYLSEGGERVGALMGGSGQSGNHLGLISTQSQADYLFDSPFQLTREGHLVDVPGGASRSADLSSGLLNFNNFLLAGYVGSAYEHYIWQETLTRDAISSVRGLQFAHETGIPVDDITPANWASSKPPCTDPAVAPVVFPTYDCNVLNAQMAQFVASTSVPWVVHLPRTSVQYGNWKGMVFIAELNQLPASAQASFGFATY